MDKPESRICSSRSHVSTCLSEDSCKPVESVKSARLITQRSQEQASHAENKCNVHPQEPFSGKPYYHPADDDDEFLGCAHLIVPVERRLPIRPKPNLGPSKDPMEKNTTYKREFGPRPTESYHNYKPIRTYEAPTEPVADETEYRKIFYSKPIDPAQIIRPPRQELLTGPMEKTSYYKRTFLGFDSDQMKYAKPINYAPKKVKLEHPAFSGTSTTKTAYAGHFGVQKRDPILPKSGGLTGVITGRGFASQTTQRTEFIPKVGMRPPALKHHPDPYLIKPEKGVNLPLPNSTTKDAYRSYHQIIPVCAFRPKRIPIESGVPIETRTSYKDDYWNRPPEKQYKRPDWSLRKPYVEPCEKMFKDTTYQMQYKQPPQVSKTEPIRPKKVPLTFGPEDYEVKETTMKSHFRTPAKGDHKGKSFMPVRMYKKSDDHVDYITTTQSTFKGATAPRTKPFEVSQQAELQQRYMDKRMANRTIYRELFGVNYVFIPPKNLLSVEKDRCYYDRDRLDSTLANRTPQQIEVA